MKSLIKPLFFGLILAIFALISGCGGGNENPATPTPSACTEQNPCGPDEPDVDLIGPDLDWMLSMESGSPVVTSQSGWQTNGWDAFEQKMQSTTSISENDSDGKIMGLYDIDGQGSGRIAAPAQIDLRNGKQIRIAFERGNVRASTCDIDLYNRWHLNFTYSYRGDLPPGISDSQRNIFNLHVPVWRDEEGQICTGYVLTQNGQFVGCRKVCDDPPSNDPYYSYYADKKAFAEQMRWGLQDHLHYNLGISTAAATTLATIIIIFVAILGFIAI